MRLRHPYDLLANAIIDTLMMDQHDYPASHSDLTYAVANLIRKYDVRLRSVPLDREEIREGPDRCPICRLPLDGVTADLGRTETGRDLRGHIECVNFQAKRGT